MPQQWKDRSKDKTVSLFPLLFIQLASREPSTEQMLNNYVLNRYYKLSQKFSSGSTKERKKTAILIMQNIIGAFAGHYI